MVRIKTGNVVKELLIGNTKVKICDDFCRGRTPEEIDKTLYKIAEHALIELSTSNADESD